MVTRHDACRHLQNFLQNTLESIADVKTLAVFLTLTVFALMAWAIIAR